MHPNSGERSVEAIEMKILAYLNRNPRAKDTIEGIMQWWLLDQEIRFELDRVQEALRRLVRNRLVLEHRQIDGRILYQLNRNRPAGTKTD